MLIMSTHYTMLYMYFDKHPIGCKAQLVLKCLFTPTLSTGDFYRQSRSDWPSFGVPSEFITIGLCSAYKSLCAAVTICASLVNIQTHTQTHRQTTFDQLILTVQPSELKKVFAGDPAADGFVPNPFVTHAQTQLSQFSIELRVNKQ